MYINIAYVCRNEFPETITYLPLFEGGVLIEIQKNTFILCTYGFISNHVFLINTRSGITTNINFIKICEKQQVNKKKNINI